MTIALGAVCSDGIVLGVDLEYTQEYAAMPGQKIFWLPQNFDQANYFIVIAAANNADTAKTVVDLLETACREHFPEGQTTLDDLKDVIKIGSAQETDRLAD